MIVDLSLSVGRGIFLDIAEVEDVIALSVSIVKPAGWSLGVLGIGIGLITSGLFYFDHWTYGWLHLIHSLDLWRAFLWDINTKYRLRDR
jgi:hypothetical protein